MMRCGVQENICTENFREGGDSQQPIFEKERTVTES